MSFLYLKKEIIDRKLCCSCGACVAVCPNDVLEIDTLANLPKLDKKSSQECSSCNACREVCPGINTDIEISEKRIFSRRRAKNEGWLGIRKAELLLKNSKMTNTFSSGGVATNILLEAMGSGVIEAAITINRDKKHKYKPVAIFADNVKDIRSSAQSTYCIVPNLQLLKEIKHKKIGLVGLPCQIEAVNKIFNKYPDIDISKKIVLTVELACCSNTDFNGTKHVIEKELKQPLSEVEELKYRNKGYPGDFYIRLKNGREYSYPFWKMVECFKDFKTHRCNACPDWWSGLADISVADGNPNIYKLSKDQTNKIPSSLVFIRTNKGVELVKRCIDKGIFSASKCEFKGNLGLERKINRYMSLFLQKEIVPNLPSSLITPFNAESDDKILTDMKTYA